MTITTLGATIGLIVAIILIIKKFEPFYCLVFGALIGGLVGGANLVETVEYMAIGAKDMAPSILRVMTSGFLAATLIKTGAVEKISEEIIKLLGLNKAILGIVLSAMVLAGVGVDLDVVVLTVGPIGMSIGHKLGYSKLAILLAALGGGKAGNIISPNPNTLAAATNFNVNLSSVMLANVIPAICGIIVTTILAKLLINKGSKVDIDINIEEDENLPSLFASLIGPIVSIGLLFLGNISSIVIDPLVALPIGAVVSIIATKNLKNTREYMSFGVAKMQGVCILLLGTGTLVGIIQMSNLQHSTIGLLDMLNVPQFLLAPISGMVMSLATASTTGGSTIASSTFSQAILSSGLSGVSGAAMVNAGACVFEHLPHGALFHASTRSVSMDITERFKLIHYEIIIGVVIVVASTIVQLVLMNL
ncbi:GntP family permease [Clostridium sp. CCUG 7971]|uniref:GntP family permease n=1 Tax=Clostridium sp. CCUG 7971 TaxID=2811414 RepID=UPI001ABB5095|nr:GntP family permease [Clostridium sp. CCUG 7971]MBO3443916.1 GntP family permease [Clostridium sp. CCUG 7971]